MSPANIDRFTSSFPFWMPFISFSYLIALASTLLNISKDSREFIGGPVDGTWCFHFQGLDSIPSQETNILQAMWHGQKIRKKEIKGRNQDILG